jgi:hypothetical protein
MSSLLKLGLRRSSSTGGERFARFSTTIYEGCRARFQDGLQKEKKSSLAKLTAGRTVSLQFQKEIKAAGGETSGSPHRMITESLRVVDLAPPL